MTAAPAAERFRALHERKGVLVLPNAWDVMTARAFEDCGFAAIGTTSFGIARAHGLRDGANDAFEVTLAMVRRMTGALSVPLSVDFESGFSDDPAEVARNAAAFVEAGAAGFNLEDGAADPALHCEKIRALKRLSTALEVPVFINARTDVFWLRLGPLESRLEMALERARAYVAAGADGIFIPGLSEPAQIRRAVDAIQAPLNVLAGPRVPPVSELAAAGVKRLSTGSAPARATLGLLRRIAAELQGPGTATFAADAPSYDEANRL